MAKSPANARSSIYAWHRHLLAAAAIFTVLLVGMGDILCVTQSIRNCPDWPGCFGRLIPPAETGPVLEYTHRLLAGISSLLIVSSAVVGMVRVPHMRWISIPPLIAIALLLEVSFFGAQVVLRGLSPGWATLEVGSALLVVALIVTAAVKASRRTYRSIASDLPDRKAFYARLALATTALVYVVLVSGILVAGKGSITGCLGWPLYSVKQFQLDGHAVANSLRLILSLAGVGMLVALFVLARRNKRTRPLAYRTARWVGLAFLVEALVQVLLLGFGLLVPLLVIYTLVAAVLWASLVALTVRAYS